MTLVSALWSRIAGYVAALGAIVLLIFGAWAKGRSSAKRDADLKDIKNANDIRRDGAAARSSANPDRMQDDGWRRD